MKLQKPTMYQKDIFNISYSTLKKQKVRVLLFDLDNTIIPFHDKIVPSKTIELFKKIKNDFKVVIFSNSPKKRVMKFASILDVDFISLAMKPNPKSFYYVIDKYNVKKNEIMIIGDQLLTDLKGGCKAGILTCLTDPLVKKELFLTKLNRYREKKYWLYLEKEYNLKKGEYYE